MKSTTIFFFLFCMTQFASAQVVSTVKDKKMLIDLEGQAWNIGDKAFALDGQGKRKALVQLKQVKNGKAVAEILKGSAQSGMMLTLAKKRTSQAGGGGFNKYRKTNSAYGFTAALMSNTMKISSYNSATIGSTSFEMAGTNFGIGGFYDYPLSSTWFVRAHGTLEMFDVSKKFAGNVCKQGTSGNCNAQFTQLGAYGTFNVAVTPAPFRYWIGGGGGALIYLSKSSTVLNTSNFFFNTNLMFATGFDWFTSRNTFIPVAFEYQMIPDKEAAVSSLVIRAGWGKTF